MTPVLGLLTPLLFGLAGRALLRASPPLARLPWPTRAAYSYLLGVAAVAGTLFLGSHLFGVPIDRDVSRVVFAVWIVAGAVVARRRPALSPRPFLGRRPGARRAVLAWSALVAALGASVLLDSLVNPIIDWDGRITWTAHARYVASAGTVDAPALAEPAWLVAHPQYPLLLPLAQVAIQETLESSDERTMRPLYATFLPVFLVLILDAGRRWGGTLAGVGASGMVAVVPWIAFNPDGGALGAYSDLPLACLFGGGLILLLSPAGWRGVALPAGVLLGGAALAKNEGMALALAALAGGAVHWLLQRRAPRRSGHLLLRLLGTAACVAVALGAHWSWSRGIAQRYDEGYATLLLGGEFFRNLAVQLPDTLAQGFLIMSSPPWATLWGAVGALLLLGAAGLRRRPVAPFAAALVGGAAAFLLVYSSGTWPESRDLLIRVTWPRLQLQLMVPILALTAMALRPLLRTASPGVSRRSPQTVAAAGPGSLPPGWGRLPLFFLVVTLLPGHLLPERWAVVAALGPVAAATWVGWRLAGRLLPGAGSLDRLAAAGVAATASWQLAALAGGVLGVLDAWSLRLGLAVLVAAAAYLPAPAPLRVPLPSGRRPAGAVLGLALATLVACGWLARRHMDQPAGWFAFDDTSYHLAAVATWHHYGDLRMPKLPLGDAGTPFYPISGELLAWGLLALLGGSDFLARWAQLLPAAAALVSTAAVARRFGLGRRAAIACTLVPLAIPRAAELVLTAGNDWSLALYLVATLHAVMMVRERVASRAAWVYVGLAAGMAAATKYLALLFLAPILALGAAGVVAASDLRRTWRPILWGLGAAAFAALAVGGYTYVRNALATGNPLFPWPVSVGGYEVLAGWEGASLEVRRQGPEATVDALGFVLRRDLFGRVAPLLVLPGALLAPFLLYRRRAPWTALAATLPVVFYLQWLFVVHDHRDVRYLLAAVLLAGIGTTLAVERLVPARWRDWGLPAMLALVTVGAYGRFLHWGLEIVVALGAATAGALLWARLRPWAARPSRRAWQEAAVVLVLVLAAVVGAQSRGYQARQQERRPAAAWLEAVTREESVVVAYTGWNQPYPYYGRGLRNRVEVVPTSRDAEFRYFDLGRDAGALVGKAGKPRTWLRNLEELGVRYVVAHVGTYTAAPPEREWMAAREDRFRLLFEGPVYEIWEVLPPTVAEPREGGPGD